MSAVERARTKALARKLARQALSIINEPDTLLALLVRPVLDPREVLALCAAAEALADA